MDRYAGGLASLAYRSAVRQTALRTAAAVEFGRCTKDPDGVDRNTSAYVCAHAIVLCLPLNRKTRKQRPGHSALFN